MLPDELAPDRTCLLGPSELPVRRRLSGDAQPRGERAKHLCARALAPKREPDHAVAKVGGTFRITVRKEKLHKKLGRKLRPNGSTRFERLANGGDAVTMTQMMAVQLVVSGLWGSFYYREIRGRPQPRGSPS